MLFSGRSDILVYTPKPSADYAQSGTPFDQARENPGVVSLSQRRPSLDTPQWKIPVSEWPNVVRRIIENQESLRKVAEDYGVSYETIRRAQLDKQGRGDNNRGRGAAICRRALALLSR
ncbi:hypothetical protein KSC_058020 [Ktedonobacter sp. SOSP1-52]|nr:hypothetical protein KSC_058020 [Ktedonobacter sp. SOSP1-52]